MKLIFVSADTATRHEVLELTSEQEDRLAELDFHYVDIVKRNGKMYRPHGMKGGSQIMREINLMKMSNEDFPQQRAKPIPYGFTPLTPINASGQYYAEDGTLMNANGTRSIFDDVDE